jgi:hypothetical protein
VSGDARRERRWIAWTAIGVVAAMVLGLMALQMNASRLEADLQEAAARSAARPAGTARVTHPPVTRARAAPTAPVVSRAAMHAAEASPISARSKPLPASAPLPPPPDLDAAIEALIGDGPPGFFALVTARLMLAVRDTDYELPDVVRSWLDAHAAAIDVVAAALASDDDGSVARRVLDAVVRTQSDRGVIMLTKTAENARRLSAILTADAVRWTEDGEPATADESMQALLRLTITAGDEGRGYWIADPGLLRRVRPSSAPGWIARIDAASPREDCLGFIRNRALTPRRPEPVRLDDPTLDVLHDDLPGPIREALDAAVFTPLEDARWARRSMRLLALHDELAASVECLPDHGLDSALLDLRGEPDWREVWDRAVVQEADLMLAREVLRLARPEAGIAPRSSPCPDWSIDVMILSPGRRWLRVIGPGRGGVAHLPGAPPLEYELPP